METSRDVKAGEELFIEYGTFSDWELLAKYGFTLGEANPYSVRLAAMGCSVTVVPAAPAEDFFMNQEDVECIKKRESSFADSNKVLFRSPSLAFARLRLRSPLLAFARLHSPSLAFARLRSLSRCTQFYVARSRAALPPAPVISSLVTCVSSNAGRGAIASTCLTSSNPPT